MNDEVGYTDGYYWFIAELAHLPSMSMTNLTQKNCFELPASVRSKINAFQVSNKKGVIFLGNDASLTGAPMVLLSLVQTFKEDGYECFILLPKGGQLLERYQQIATVLLCDHGLGPLTGLQVFLESMSPSIKGGKIVRTVVANSVEVLKLQAVMKQYGLKVLSLVHELADYYPNGYFNKLYDASNHVIFSSEFSLNSALQRSTRPKELKLEVKMQGLLPSTSEPADTATSRNQIRTELGVSKNAFIVLSCGSITLRKGIDNFIQTARIFQQSHSEKLDTRASPTAGTTTTADREVLFVWIGDSPVDDPGPLHFVLWDIKQMGLKNIRLLKPRQDLAAWFAGADVFLLPSKQDPMPCVAHNSLAAGIPVIAFADAGGTEELLRQGGGTLVDYGDVGAMSDAVLNYLLNEDVRVSAGLAGQRIATENLRFSEYYQHIKQIVDKPVACAVQDVEDAKVITLEEKIEFLKLRLRARLSSKSWRCTQGLRLVKKFLTPSKLLQSHKCNFTDPADLVNDFDPPGKGNDFDLTVDKGNTYAVTDAGSGDNLDLEETCSSSEFYLEHLRQTLQSIRTSLSWRLSRPVRAKQISATPDISAAIRAILAPGRARVSKQLTRKLATWG